MNQAFRILMPALLLAAAGHATVILNTGQGSGPDDPIWTITAGGSGPAQIITNPITLANAGPWANPLPNSAWVSTTTSNSLPSGTYTISTTFSAETGDLFTFRALADNRLQVLIDGVNIDGVGGFHFIGLVASNFSTIPAPRTVALGSMPGDIHTIDLVVTNDGGFSGVLFLAETPEPATFVLAGLPLVALGLWRRRNAQTA
ncbi:MAG: hypothetical protein JST93_13370 [Acidobacteria bacterium]|nr:hypothetical protein [Acidobacteriota bacterium]